MWPIQFFSNLLNFCAKTAKWLGAFAGFVAWVVGVIDLAVGAVIRQISTLFAAFKTDGLGNANFASVEYIGYANAVIPISEMLTVIAIYTTVWLTVIIIRWVKSFVPTLAN